MKRLIIASGVVLAVMAVPATAMASTVPVRPGDTLSGIAQRYCHHADDWTGIFQASRSVIGGDPNLIYPGQRLTLKCDDPSWLLPLAGPAHPEAAAAVVPAPAYSASPVYAPAPASAAVYSGSGSMQQCIIRAESGGNSQIWNASGHYGLYQFSYSTWTGSGGNGADFGHASVAEQNQVFANAVAARGYSDWAPYDGC